MNAYVDVIPLQPPFEGEVVTLYFHDAEKALAITKSDYLRIVAMFGTDLTERTVTLSKAPDNEHIRIEPITS
jgi:hypothetical protein